MESSTCEGVCGVERPVEVEGITGDLIVSEITGVEVNTCGHFLASHCICCCAANESGADNVDVVEVEIECVC